jgi:hypothetical protein
MKEVFTKNFWREVKRTFDEAREGASSEKDAVSTPAEAAPQASVPAVTGTSPSATSEQDKQPANE